MKIAVSSAGEKLDSLVDPRFGRCPYFAMVELETGRLEAVANPAQDAAGGAGTLSAQFVIEQGAEAVLTGKCGPKASAVLADAGVEVVTGVSGAVGEAVEQFRQRNSTSTTEQGGSEPGFGPGRGQGRGDGPGRGRGPGAAGRGPGGGANRGRQRGRRGR